MNHIFKPAGKGKYANHIASIENWINHNSSGSGIYFSSRDKREYPEVTGYWIETALRWGFVEKARSWYEWLLQLQHEDGGWPDITLSNESMFFDSGQIIRGIKYYSKVNKLSISKIENKYLEYFDYHKVDYLTPKSFDMEQITWKLVNLQVAAIVYKYWPKHIDPEWIEKTMEKFLQKWDVGYRPSHFDIYILEAFHDLGIFQAQTEKFCEFFDKGISKYGLVVTDRFNQATCYPASSQLAVLYHKMGRHADADKIMFNMLDRLDVKKGNWPGSERGGLYLENVEISWGLKYFLDTLYEYSTHQFDLDPKSEWDKVENPFHQSILDQLNKHIVPRHKVLEVGCGLGRYLQKTNSRHRFGIDISVNNVKACKRKNLTVNRGLLTNYSLPKSSPKKYNLIYFIESFEHAVFPKNAIGVAADHLLPNGKIIIVDKDKYSCRNYTLSPFEKYYSQADYKKIAAENNLQLVDFYRLGSFSVAVISPAEPDPKQLFNNPLISVIIPTFNRAEWLLEAVKSVQNQSHQNLEIIISDDGSTDQTESMVRKLMKTDDKITYLKNSHSGLPSVARNKGIKKSHGTFVAFLDDDDQWIPTKLAAQLKFMKQTRSDLVCSNAWKRNDVYGDKVYFSEHIDQNISFSRLATSNIVINSSVLLKAQILKKTGLLLEDVTFKAIEDFDLWLRIITFGKIKYQNEKLVYYHDDPTHSIRKYFDDQITINVKIMKQYLRWCLKTNNLNQNMLNAAIKLYKLRRTQSE